MDIGIYFYLFVCALISFYSICGFTGTSLLLLWINLFTGIVSFLLLLYFLLYSEFSDSSLLYGEAQVILVC